MWTAFQVATSGAAAQQRALDAAAQNLANLHTTGYKATRAHQVDAPAGRSEFSTISATGGIELTSEGVGQGVIATLGVQNLSQGAVQSTGRSLDLAIEGRGFLAVRLPDGQTGYTRDGRLQIGADGHLATADGAPLSPEIVTPPAASTLQIAPDGAISVQLETGERQSLGQIQLVTFDRPDALVAIGGNLFVATPQAGTPSAGAPATGRRGTLEAGFLESSNVDVGVELTRVLQAQRAYQANLRAVRVVDEMVQDANQLQHS